MDGLVPQLTAQFGSELGQQLPSYGKALFFLIVGWIAAKIIAGIVTGLLHKTTIDNKLAGFITGKEDSDFDIEGLIGTTTYYVIMLLVIVAVFDALDLDVVALPLNDLLHQVLVFVPRIFAAVLLLFFAWVVASGLRVGVTKLLTKLEVDQKLKIADDDEELPFTKSVAETIYWGVFLVFLPGVLGALEMQGILAPVQTMLNQVMAYIPNIIGAGMIMAVGWFAARIIERIVSNLLAASGLDKLSESVGLSTALGKAKLSKTIGLIAYVLILLPAVVGALDALEMKAVTMPVNQLLTAILGAVPGIFSAVLILALFHVLGRFVGNLVSQLTGSLGFDKLPLLLGFAPKLAEAESGKSPSYILGQVVYIALMLIAVVEASSQIGFDFISKMVQEFAFFATDIIAGVVIIGVGLYLGTLASRAISASGVSSADFLGGLARIAIVFLAGAMGLRRMGLANEIIELAFGLIIGAVALAIAVAFGLGAKDVVGKEVEGWLKSAKSSK